MPPSSSTDSNENTDSTVRVGSNDSAASGRRGATGVDGRGGRAGSAAARGTGDDVLDWLRSSEARSLARTRLQRGRLPASEFEVDDVLADAQVAVLRRMRSAEPLVVDTPAAYGTTVVANVVTASVRGRDPLVLTDDPDELDRGVRPGGLLGDVDPGDPNFEDDVRTSVEHLGGHAWLSAATLAFLTFTITPADPPPQAPCPKSGATETQATCWSALWLAGVRDVFPDRAASDPAVVDGAARRRKRARRIQAVVDHLERAHAHLADAWGRGPTGTHSSNTTSQDTTARDTTSRGTTSRRTTAPTTGARDHG